MSPSTLIDLIKQDPWSWFWSPDVQVELFALLPRLWNSIGSDDRQSLVDFILQGPPRRPLIWRNSHLLTSWRRS